MTLSAKAPRPKKCKNPACGISFPPQRLGQSVCSPKCGLAIKDVNGDRARKAIAQRERREIKAAKERIKSRADYLKEAQSIINRYVRLRDASLGCVSCDKPATWSGQWHASHFRSVGAAKNLRFNLWNIHKACSVCNNHLSGNIGAYRPALVAKIGAERVDWLDAAQAAAKHDIEYLKRLKRVFAKKGRRLEARSR